MSIRIQAVTLLALLLGVRGAAAQTYEVLHHFRGNDGHGFNGNTDGANPSAPLVLGPDGRLYGTTISGSAGNTGPTGTIFVVNAAGQVTILHHFALEPLGGTNPQAGLIVGRDGFLYGATHLSVGNTSTNGGTIFKIDALGNYARLHTFLGNAGGGPIGGVIQAANGDLYGANTRGGTNSNGTAVNIGTVFRIQTSGLPPVQLALFPFGRYDSYKSGLIQASDGNLYGTTRDGPANTSGTIYRTTPGGGLELLYSFVGGTGSGANPLAPLIQSTDGNLYGTTYYGGVSNQGTIFKMTLTGQVTTLHSFNLTNGGTPQAALIQATDGNFYGTTRVGGEFAGGTIFRMTPAGIVTTVHAFKPLPPSQSAGDGFAPQAAVVQGADGKLYGTTYRGGLEDKGIVFRLDLGLKPPTATVPPPPQPRADLAVTISDSPDPLILGGGVTYTIRASNAGPDAATNVTLSVTLSAGVQVSVTAAQGTCSGAGTLACALGSLAPGGSATVTVVVTPAVVGTASASASATSGQADPNPANNSATASTTVSAPTPRADLMGRWQALSESCRNQKCTVTGTFVARNDGLVDAGRFVTRFYLSTDQVFDAGDTLLQERATTSLRAGREVSLSLSATTGAGATGKFIIAVVDAAQAVAESDESNNRVAQAVSPVR